MPVIDVIQGEGFNPLWQQVLTVFNEGFTPHQFVSKRRSWRLRPNPILKSLST